MSSDEKGSFTWTKGGSGAPGSNFKPQANTEELSPTLKKRNGKIISFDAVNTSMASEKPDPKLTDRQEDSIKLFAHCYIRLSLMEHRKTDATSRVEEVVQNRHNLGQPEFSSTDSAPDASSTSLTQISREQHHAPTPRPRKESHTVLECWGLHENRNNSSCSLQESYARKFDDRPPRWRTVLSERDNALKARAVAQQKAEGQASESIRSHEKEAKDKASESTQTQAERSKTNGNEENRSHSKESKCKPGESKQIQTKGARDKASGSNAKDVQDKAGESIQSYKKEAKDKAIENIRKHAKEAKNKASEIDGIRSKDIQEKASESNQNHSTEDKDKFNESNQTQTDRAKPNDGESNQSHINEIKDQAGGCSQFHTEGTDGQACQSIQSPVKDMQDDASESIPSYRREAKDKASESRQSHTEGVRH
jgi:hypothetical protein